jgi:hypothetical protein
MTKIIQPLAISYKDIELSWMFGRSIMGVVYQEPALRYFASMAEFQMAKTSTDSALDPTIWHFTLGPDASISVEGLWRIIRHVRIVLTSDDHGRQFGLPAPIDAIAKSTELLAGRQIEAVQLREATADILIALTDGIRLEIIAASSGYESWQIRDPSGTQYFAQAGGQICRWRT